MSGSTSVFFLKGIRSSENIINTGEDDYSPSSHIVMEQWDVY